MHQHGDSAPGGVELAAPHPAHQPRHRLGPLRALSCSRDARRRLLPRPVPWSSASRPFSCGSRGCPGTLPAVIRPPAAPRPCRAPSLSPRRIPGCACCPPTLSRTGRYRSLQHPLPSARLRAAQAPCHSLAEPSITGWAGLGPRSEGLPNPPSGVYSERAMRLRRAPAPRWTRRGAQLRLRTEFSTVAPFPPPPLAEVAGPCQFRLGVVRSGQNGEDRQDPRR